MSNSRAIVVIIFIFIFCAAIVAKLVNIQIVKSDELKFYAQRQQTEVEKIKADRGLIYDRNSVLLAYNRNDISFYVDLRMISKNGKSEIAKKFSAVFNKPQAYFSNLLSSTGKTICIEKKAPSEKALQLKDFKVSGLFYREEPTRVYYYDKLASHLLGYVNNDLQGVNGIEKSFDSVLTGEDGTRLIERDAIGDMITVSEKETKAAVAGDNLYLTISRTYQSILEAELQNGLNEYGGTSAIGIVMNPNDGEILALASLGDFDPNEYWKYSDAERRDRAITDTYEPGSTFKSISMSILLDNNLCKENELLNVENGRYKFKSVFISDTHQHTYLTVDGILEQSSNIGMAKLSQRLNDNTFYKYLRGFGFGNYTAVNLPGEAQGKLKKPNSWGSLTKAFMSYGYELSVTPLQIATAYCALINGGILYQPRLIKKIVSADGEENNTLDSKEIRRVISKQTSDKIKKMMVGVVENGTGKNAKLSYITVGGKTGTSQKLINGRYSKSDYNSSFIGFFPVDHPQILCFVLVNSPSVGRYGGMVAAPIFKNISERIISSDPDLFQDQIKNFKEQEVEYKTVDLKNYDKKTNIQIIHADNEITNKIKKGDFKNIKVMPDLSNYSLRDAIHVLTKLGITYKVKGSGKVISQTLNPGDKIDRSQICVLTCENNNGGAKIY